MANYICSDTDLTSIADAIRTKGGTSAELVFPAEFISAIADIPSGSSFPYEYETGELTGNSSTTISISYTGTHTNQPSVFFMWDTTEPSKMYNSKIKSLMMVNLEGAIVKPDGTTGSAWGLYDAKLGSTSNLGYTTQSGYFNQTESANAFNPSGLVNVRFYGMSTQDQHIYRWISIW